jgi:hypothetical protein
MRARAGDPTDLRSSNPTHSPGRRTSFFLRHYKPAPNDGVDVKDLRPLTRSALPGRSWTPTPQPALPKNGGGRKKKDQPAVGRHYLDKSSPFRDESASRHAPGGRFDPSHRQITVTATAPAALSARSRWSESKLSGGILFGTNRVERRVAKLCVKLCQSCSFAGIGVVVLIGAEL